MSGERGTVARVLKDSKVYSQYLFQYIAGATYRVIRAADYLGYPEPHEFGTKELIERVQNVIAFYEKREKGIV